MGYKGTLSAIQTEINRSRRAAEQRAKAALREMDANQRATEVRRAAMEVEAHEALIAVLQSVHQEVSQGIDWAEIAAMPPPPEPQRSSDNEIAAREALDSFAPSGMFKKRSESKREGLVAAVAAAKERDSSTYSAALASHASDVKEWSETRDVAERVLRGELAAYAEALAMLRPFGDLEELGATVEVEFLSRQVAKAKVRVAGESAIPRETKRLLQSGKLSVKEMSKSAFYSLYQDYVCSAVLRVASELTHLLPVTAAVVTAVDDLVDPSTGHMKEQAILSVAVPERTLALLNLAAIDPSEALSNFVHNMKFKKTSGFEQVTPVDLGSLKLTD